MIRQRLRLLLLFLFLLPLIVFLKDATSGELTPKEQLGKSIFFDQNLSILKNQSCATCHDPQAGWSGPDSAINAHGAVYGGSIKNRFGNRKPPSASYVNDSPVLHYATEDGEGLFIGGNFWDGRATGEILGSPVAEQAQVPFLNPVEHGLLDKACVVFRVCNPGADYPVSFENVWGAGSCRVEWPKNMEQLCSQESEPVALSVETRVIVDKAFDRIGLAVAAFEASPEVNQYTSKFDYYQRGLVQLTQLEKKGLDLFEDKGKCADCHPLEPAENQKHAAFTDFTYDNLGIPKNMDNPTYGMPEPFNPDGAAWIDEGLGGFLRTTTDYRHIWLEHVGKHKVPSLRNVDKRPSEEFVKAYGHNGYFKSLKEIVHFYNTRDVLAICYGGEDEIEGQTCWPVPEVTTNVNTDELGDLQLTDAEELAIVAFLKILSDGYKVP